MRRDCVAGVWWWRYSCKNSETAKPQQKVTQTLAVGLGRDRMCSVTDTNQVHQFDDTSSLCILRFSLTFVLFC